MKTSITYKVKSRDSQITLNVIIALLLLLWIPVMIDKVMEFETFRIGISRQPLPSAFKRMLIYIIPVLEGLVIFGLMIKRLQGYGLLLSTLLMVGFTAYIGAALLGTWEKLPCGCGSVISGMSWTQHFFFNLFFLALSGLGLYVWYKQRNNYMANTVTSGVHRPNGGY